MRAYADLADMPEDERIRFMGDMFVKSGKLNGFAVDYGPGYEGKGDRYVKKLLDWFPTLELVARFPNTPFAGVEFIQVRPKGGDS